MRSLFNGLWLMLCVTALCLVGCGRPNMTYGGGPGDSAESPSGETIPGAEGQTSGSSDSPDGLTCLEVYNAVSACYTVYYDCSGACQDQSCADACEAEYNDCFQIELSLGSAVAQEQFGALRTCEENVYQGCYDQGLVVYEDCAEACSDDACLQACGAQANDILQSCMVEECIAEYGACGIGTENETPDAENGSGTGSTGGNENGSSGAGSASSNFSCGELYECEDACNGNQACGQACYDQGTDQAQSQWTSLIQCGQSMCDGLVANADEYRDCLQYYCSAQYNTCFTSGDSSSPGTGGSTGGGTCGNGYSCVQNCYTTSTNESTFNVCVDSCYSAMSTDAVVLMNSLVACSNIECVNVPGSVENYYRCQEDFCPSEYNACIGHTASGSTGSQPTGGPGHSSCLEIHEGILEVCVPAHSECVAACSNDDCAQACAQTMEGCIDAQQEGAPAVAVANFQAMYGCRQSHYQSCYDEANESYMACMDACGAADTACQSGCNTEAGNVYENCFSIGCANEYSACGM